MHLVDTTLFYAPEGGGVGRYLGAKHAWLKEHTAVRHTILAPAMVDANDPPPGVATMSSFAWPGLHGYRFPLRIRRWRQRLLELNPHLIEAGDPFIPAWAALSAGQELGIPVVGFYHSDLQSLLASRLGQVAGRVVEKYIGHLYRRFDLVLAPSHIVADKLEALGIERVAYQPLGVDTSVFHPQRRDPQLRRSLGLADSTRLIVFAGRFAREKNLEVLLETFRRLGTPYHLLLVGSGHRIPAQRNVTVVDYCTNPLSLARLLASCDALVHAGDRETFGLVILEAMACGLPVVAVAGTALADVVAGAGILVSPCKVGAFCEGIRALYDRPLRTLGATGRQRVTGEFSWDAVMRSLLGHYARLAAMPVPRLPQLYATR